MLGKKYKGRSGTWTVTGVDDKNATLTSVVGNTITMPKKDVRTLKELID